MRFACWIIKATNTHPEYVTLIAFPLQQWFGERASTLRYTYIACVVRYNALVHVLATVYSHLQEVSVLSTVIVVTYTRNIDMYDFTFERFE
jgi:hypothetical protein